MDDERQERSTDVGTSAGAAASEAAAYARAGEVLTRWVNERLATSPPAVLALGTKRATVLELQPAGALRVEVAGEAGAAPEPQLVALDGPRLEALLRRLLQGR